VAPCPLQHLLGPLCRQAAPWHLLVALPCQALCPLAVAASRSAAKEGVVVNVALHHPTAQHQQQQEEEEEGVGVAAVRAAGRQQGPGHLTPTAGGRPEPPQ
jgi:hypothetical protein